MRHQHRRQITFFAAVAVAALGGSIAARPFLTPSASAAGPVLGRYQLSQSQGMLYFVDTVTGRVWSAPPTYSKAMWHEIGSPVQAPKE